MRSPVIAFSLIAAAAVSPTLVSGAPTSPQLENAIAQTEAAANTHQIRAFPDTSAGTQLLQGLGLGKPTDKVPPKADVQDKVAETQEPAERTAALRKAHAEAAQKQPSNDASSHNPPFGSDMAGHSKRATDDFTAGGNGFTGNSANTSGGNVINYADRGNLKNSPSKWPFILVVPVAHCFSQAHLAARLATAASRTLVSPLVVTAVATARVVTHTLVPPACPTAVTSTTMRRATATGMAGDATATGSKTPPSSTPAPTPRPRTSSAPVSRLPLLHDGCR